MAAEGGRIDFMFLGPLLTRPLDPLLHCHQQLLFTAVNAFWDGEQSLCKSNILVKRILKRSQFQCPFE